MHILTGPIYVCGAEPGDVLQVTQYPPFKPRLSCLLHRLCAETVLHAEPPRSYDIQAPCTEPIFS